MFSLYTMSKLQLRGVGSNVRLDGGTLREVFDGQTGLSSVAGAALAHFARCKIAVARSPNHDVVWWSLTGSNR